MRRGKGQWAWYKYIYRLSHISGFNGYIKIILGNILLAFIFAAKILLRATDAPLAMIPQSDSCGLGRALETNESRHQMFLIASLSWLLRLTAGSQQLEPQPEVSLFSPIEAAGFVCFMFLIKIKREHSVVVLLCWECPDASGH